MTGPSLVSIFGIAVAGVCDPGPGLADAGYRKPATLTPKAL
jgi:hypothetical protein